MKRSSKMIILGVVASLGATVALAHSENAAVRARQAAMQLYGFNLGQLGAMAKGDVEYNAEVAAGAAANLAALAKLDQSQMWPAGTDSASMEGTRALPDMWENFPDVVAKAEALSAAADAMASAAGTDLASLQGAMAGVGGACGACHKAYRAPE